MRRTLAATTLGLAVLPFALTACGSNDMRLDTSSQAESGAPSTGTDAGAPGARRLAKGRPRQRPESVLASAPGTAGFAPSGTSALACPAESPM